MHTYKISTSIPSDRKLSLDVPPSVPVGPVEIIMIYPEQAKSSCSDVIAKSFGSLKGSKLTTERFMQLKNNEKELER